MGMIQRCKRAFAFAVVAVTLAASAMAQGTDPVEGAVEELQAKMLAYVGYALAAVIAAITAGAGIWAIMWIFRKLRGGVAAGGK